MNTSYKSKKFVLIAKIDDEYIHMGNWPIVYDNYDYITLTLLSDLDFSLLKKNGYYFDIYIYCVKDYNKYYNCYSKIMEILILNKKSDNIKLLHNFRYIIDSNNKKIQHNGYEIDFNYRKYKKLNLISHPHITFSKKFI